MFCMTYASDLLLTAETHGTQVGYALDLLQTIEDYRHIDEGLYCVNIVFCQVIMWLVMQGSEV